MNKGILYKVSKIGVFLATKKFIRKIEENRYYKRWLIRNEPGKKELKEQKNTKFERNFKFSIVVPIYRTNKDHLIALIDSIVNQTYSNWELCLVDASEYRTNELAETIEIIRKYSDADTRIKTKIINENLGISDNTNMAIEMATGEFLVFADHDDILAPNALFECAKVLEHNQEIDVIYTDEDKINFVGTKRFQPYFKPDFNIDLLRSNNYICHLFVVKKSLANDVGKLNKQYDGAQDYDFILRCVEKSKKIYHIPLILYHWRCSAGSTAENPESKLYAFDAGKKVLESHFNRVGIPAIVVNGPYYGTYHTIYKYKTEPRITIIVVGNRKNDKLCVDSIESNSNYSNKEYIFLEKIQDIKNIIGDISTNYIWIINNTFIIRTKMCIEEMMGYLLRHDVGAVGGKLCKNSSVLQAGIDMDNLGNLSYPFKGYGNLEAGSFNRLVSARDCYSMSLDCVMLNKDLLLSLIQDEGFALSDKLEIILGEKIKKNGKLVVYNPNIECDKGKR